MSLSSCFPFWAVLIALLLAPLPAGARQTFESSTMFYHFDYKEDCPPPLKSTEEDWLLGSHLAYTYQGEKTPLYGRLLFEYARAATDYDGTDQQGNPLSGETVNTFLTTEANLGWQLPLSRNSHFTPYSGIGYRLRDRDLGLYSEEYDWFYIPLGLRLDYRLTDKWSLALDAAVRFIVDAQVQVNFSEMDPSRNDPEADLSNEVGFFISLPITYQLYSWWGIAFTPWYEDIDLGRCPPFPITENGETVAMAYVPESKTRQYGLNLGVLFNF